MSDPLDDDGTRREAGSLSDDGIMKVLYTSAGYIAGIHKELDACRDGYDAQNPVDHNIEQAQIALENATMRLSQVMHHVADRIKAAESLTEEPT
jgi:hypothetical protein